MTKAISGAPPQRKKKIVFPVGRGARGKTTYIRYAVEMAQSGGREVMVADVDRTNPTLADYFADVARPKDTKDGEVSIFLDRFITEFVNSDIPSAVVDFGGGDQILKAASAEMTETGVSGGMVGWMQGLNVEPVVLHFIGPDSNDLAYLRDLERVLAPPCTAVILNQGLVPAHRSAASAFAETVMDNDVLKAAVTRGCKLISMPNLKPAAEIDLQKISFRAAAAGQCEGMGLMDRQRVVVWLREMDRAFAPIAEWLP